MLEQRLNEFFGDDDPTGFGTGWWSGVLAAFCGSLSFGGVLCLHFPQLLTSPELRSHYPMFAIRILIQSLIVGAFVFGIISAAFAVFIFQFIIRESLLGVFIQEFHI